MKTIISSANRTYSFSYVYDNMIEIRLDNSPNNTLQSLSFQCEQGYSGFVIVKTNEDGDFFYLVAPNQSNASVSIDFKNFTDTGRGDVDISQYTISEIIIELNFNHLFQNKLHSHTSTFTIDIQ